MKAHQKTKCPEKVCSVCKRPFKWRKKWAKVWNEVKYCSDRCRRRKSFAENAVKEP